MQLTDTEIELRLERRCICEVEKVAPEIIEKIIRSYPEIYGRENTDPGGQHGQT